LSASTAFAKTVVFPTLGLPVKSSTRFRKPRASRPEV
jgi:hypothetical protein